MHINLEDRVETLLADLKEPAWGNLAQRWEMTVWGRHPLMIWEDNLCSMELAHAELIWGFQSFNMLMCTWTPRGQPVHFLTSADSSPSAYLWGLWLSLQWEPVTQLPGLPAPSWLLSLCFHPSTYFPWEMPGACHMALCLCNTSVSRASPGFSFIYFYFLN